MMLCVYCSERATVRIAARGWRRFACSKHDVAIEEQAQALKPRRNFVRTTNRNGFHNDGRAVGARVYHPATVDVVRPLRRKRGGPFSVEARAESKRRNANRSLSREAQAAFDALVKRRGSLAASEALGVGLSTVDKFLHGGAGKPATASRIEQALARGVSS